MTLKSFVALLREPCRVPNWFYFSLCLYLIFDGVWGLVR